MNKKLAILLPLLFALCFAGGMWLQKHFSTPLPSIDFLKKNDSKISEVLNLVSRNYVEDVNLDSISEDLLPLLFEKLDPHSSYISSEEYRDIIDPIRGSFEGIGVQFNIQKDTIVIVQVLKGGPSEKLNIKAGDRIVTVNDSVVAGNGITNEKTIKLLKGPSGTVVKVGIKREGIKDLIPFEITRGSVPIASVDAAYMIDDKTGYVAISCFSQNTLEEFLSAIQSFRDKNPLENLIVDLRENGGGLLFTAIDLASEFLKTGDTIVFTKGRNSAPDYYTSIGSGSCENLNLVVLINEYSASASEIFAGAMQDNGRAVVVGRRSFGKGVVNEDFPLRDSSFIRLTTKKFYTPCGRCIQKPYNGHLTDYDKELVDRYSHGELLEVDSINFPDSLKFTTRAGKIVYGGGGIMPDVFVPIDTISYSEMFRQMTIDGYIYNYAFSFAERNRSRLNTMGFREAYSDCLRHINWNDIYSNYGKKCDDKCSQSEIEHLVNLTCAYVVRDIFGENAFYEIYNLDDKTIQKAIEVLNQNK